MAVKRTGYQGFTIDTPSSSDGLTDKIFISIQYPRTPYEVDINISSGANDWVAIMGNGDTIALSAPKKLFVNRDNAIIQFTLNTKYPANSPCELAYNSTTSKIEITKCPDRVFTVNTYDGHFGFTVDGYGNTATNSAVGLTNKILMTIPFYFIQPKGVNVDISTDPSHWGAIMGEVDTSGNPIIYNLQNPTVISINKDNIVVSFTLQGTATYPTNSPCILVYRNKNAYIHIYPLEDDGSFIPVTNISGIPETMQGGERFDLSNAIISPPNATTQNIKWTVENGTASIDGYILTILGTGNIKIRGTITNGAGTKDNRRDFVKDFTIGTTAPEITITKQPEELIYTYYGLITQTIFCEATVPVGTLNYQWYESNNGTNGSGTRIEGANKAILDIPKNLSAGEHFFYCVVSNNVGSTPVTSELSQVIVQVKVTGVKIHGVEEGTTIPQYSIIRLTAEVLPDNATNKNVTWTSSNTDIATVDQNGFVMCNQVGEVTITCTTEDGKFTDSITLSLIPFVPVTMVTDVITTAIIDANDNYIGGRVLPENASFKDIEWSFDTIYDADVQIVDNNRLIVHSAGAYNFIKITATIINGRGFGMHYTNTYKIDIFEAFIPVNEILIARNYIYCTDVPREIFSAVIPTYATNKNIIWSIVDNGGTDIKIVNGNQLEAPRLPGNAIIRATIQDGKGIGIPYTQDFEINVFGTFIPVTDIINLTEYVSSNSTTLLEGEVVPSNASHIDIEYTIIDDGGTDAYIEANSDEYGMFHYSIVTDKKGKVRLEARVRYGVDPGWGDEHRDTMDYVEEFEITVNEVFVPIEDINMEPITIFINTDNTISSEIIPSNATKQNITWSIYNAGRTGARITNNNILRATNEGTFVISATVTSGKSTTGKDRDYVKQFTINAVKFIPVTDISGIPESTPANNIITLAGVVSPQNASFKDIQYTIKDAGETGAIIKDGALSFTSMGTCIITATIENGKAIGTPYTEDFVINVEEAVTDIKSIQGIPKTMIINTMEDVIYTTYNAPTVYTSEVTGDGSFTEDDFLSTSGKEWVGLPTYAVIRPDGKIFNNNGNTKYHDQFINLNYSNTIFTCNPAFIEWPDGFRRYTNGYIGIAANTYLDKNGSLHVMSSNFPDASEMYEISIHGIVIDKTVIPNKYIISKNTVYVLGGPTTCKFITPDGFKYGNSLIANYGYIDNSLTGGLTRIATGELDYSKADVNTIQDDYNMYYINYVTPHGSNVNILPLGTSLTIFELEGGTGVASIRHPNGLIVTIPLRDANSCKVDKNSNIVFNSNDGESVYSGLSSNILNIGYVNVSFDTNMENSDNFYRLTDGAYVQNNMLHINNHNNIIAIDITNDLKNLFTNTSATLDADADKYLLEKNGYVYCLQEGSAINPNGIKVPENAIFTMIKDGNVVDRIKIDPEIYPSSVIQWRGTTNTPVIHDGINDTRFYDCGRLVDIVDGSKQYLYFIAGINECISTISGIIPKGLDGENDYEEDFNIEISPTLRTEIPEIPDTITPPEPEVDNIPEYPGPDSDTSASDDVTTDDSISKKTGYPKLPETTIMDPTDGTTHTDKDNEEVRDKSTNIEHASSVFIAYPADVQWPEGFVIYDNGLVGFPDNVYIDPATGNLHTFNKSTEQEEFEITIHGVVIDKRTIPWKYILPNDTIFDTVNQRAILSDGFIMNSSYTIQNPENSVVKGSDIILPSGTIIHSNGIKENVKGSVTTSTTLTPPSGSYDSKDYGTVQVTTDPSGYKLLPDKSQLVDTKLADGNILRKIIRPNGLIISLPIKSINDCNIYNTPYGGYCRMLDNRLVSIYESYIHNFQWTNVMIDSRRSYADTSFRVPRGSYIMNGKFYVPEFDTNTNLITVNGINVIDVNTGGDSAVNGKSIIIEKNGFTYNCNTQTALYPDGNRVPSTALYILPTELTGNMVTYDNLVNTVIGGSADNFDCGRLVEIIAKDETLHVYFLAGIDKCTSTFEYTIDNGSDEVKTITIKT